MWLSSLRDGVDRNAALDTRRRGCRATVELATIGLNHRQCFAIEALNYMQQHSHLPSEQIVVCSGYSGLSETQVLLFAASYLLDRLHISCLGHPLAIANFNFESFAAFFRFSFPCSNTCTNLAVGVLMIFFLDCVYHVYSYIYFFLVVF